MGIGNWGLGSNFLVVTQVNHCIVSSTQMHNVELPAMTDYQSNLFWLSCILELIIENYIYAGSLFLSFLFSYLITILIPNTWSTFSASIFSNSVLFQTYFEFWYLSTHSLIRSLPSNLLPFLSGYSGSVWFCVMSSLRPPAKTTSIPSP